MMFSKSTLFLLAGTLFLAFLLSACKSGGQPEETQTAAPAEQPASGQPETDTRKVILFFGNSLTAGYGIDTEEAYPALLQRRIDSLGLPWRTVNAGLSGETTASGVTRVAWVLRQPADLFVLELGGNDGLRGISTTETTQNLLKIFEIVREKSPQSRLVLAGMMVPPSMGQRYGEEFARIFPEVATQSGAVLIPFLLEGVGGDPALNLPDGIHPTPEGHRIVAETVWKYLYPLLSE